MKSQESLFVWSSLFISFYSQVGISSAQSDKTSMYFSFQPFHLVQGPIIDKKYALDSFECLVFCMRNTRCSAVNFAVNPNSDQRFLCQLLKNVDGEKGKRRLSQPNKEYHHYRKNPCADNPCQNAGVCDVTDTSDFNCACTVPYSGRLCEQVSWTKVNQDPMCFGAKDNTFGTFFSPSPGRVESIKLVHINGTVTCDKSSRPPRNTFWGCYSPTTNISKITIIITNKNDEKLLPTYSNNLKGFHGNATAIEFSTENLPVFDEVTAGQEFRIWYYEDYYVDYHDNNSTVELDNDGLSCADVYLLYQP